MSKTCKLMIFFIMVHKNNNKVTLRTLAVNARGQKLLKEFKKKEINDVFFMINNKGFPES